MTDFIDVPSISSLPCNREYYFNYKKVSSDFFMAKLTALRENKISFGDFNCYDFEKNVITHNIVTKIFRS